MTHHVCTMHQRDACAIGAADSEVLTAWLPMGGWRVKSLAEIERQPENGVYCHG